VGRLGASTGLFTFSPVQRFESLPYVVLRVTCAGRALVRFSQGLVRTDLDPITIQDEAKADGHAQSVHHQRRHARWLQALLHTAQL
jgi:hypothetical protein